MKALKIFARSQISADGQLAMGYIAVTPRYITATFRRIREIYESAAIFLFHLIY